MESGPLGWLMVLLAVTAGLSAASASPGHSREASVSNHDGASPFDGGRPFGVGQTQAIANGRNATYDENVPYGTPQRSKWPWMALLRAERVWVFPEGICGGALINSRHVLTAAHCMDPFLMKRETLHVRLGEYNQKDFVDGNHTDYEVEAILTHPDFDVNGTSSNHDIALLRLATEVQFSAGVCTIPLPDGPTGDLAGGQVTLAGWGATYSGELGTPILQEVNLTAVGEDECFKKWVKQHPRLANATAMVRDRVFPGGFMKEKKICTEPKRRYQGGCKGDSGGPLVEYGKFQVVGVFVLISGTCAFDNAPAVYTRVSAYLDWIQKTANIPGVKTQHCQNTFIHRG